MSLGLLDPRHDAMINMVQPVNVLLPFVPSAWWLVLPGTTGGRRLMDIMSPGPNGNHGVLFMNPASAWKGTNRLGGWGAVDFVRAGSNRVEIVPGFLDSDGAPMSISGWLKVDGPAMGGEAGMLMDTADVSIGTNNGFYIFSDSRTIDNLQLTLGYDLSTDIAFWSSADEFFVDNEWVHFHVNKSNTTNWRVYRNGRPYTGTPKLVIEGSGSHVASTKNLAFGGGTDGNASFFLDGQLDDMSFHNGLLSDAEALQEYQLSQQSYPGWLNRIASGLVIPPPEPAPVNGGAGLPPYGQVIFNSADEANRPRYGQRIARGTEE